MYDFGELRQAVKYLITVRSDSVTEEKIHLAKIAQEKRVEEAYNEICDFAAAMKKILPVSFSFCYEYDASYSLTLDYSNGVFSWHATDGNRGYVCKFIKGESNTIPDCSEPIRAALIHFYNNWADFVCGEESFMEKCLETIRRTAQEIADRRSSELKKYLL